MSPSEYERPDRVVPVFVVLVVMVAAFGVCGTVMGYSTARRERDMARQHQVMAVEAYNRAEAAAAQAQDNARRALNEAAKARALQRFIAQALSSAQPGDRERDSTLIREAMDSAFKRLDRGEIKDPAVGAAIRSTIGTAYASLGDLDAAERHLRAAVELRTKALGENAPQVATDLEDLEKVLQRKSK